MALEDHVNYVKSITLINHRCSVIKKLKQLHRQNQIRAPNFIIRAHSDGKNIKGRFSVIRKIPKNITAFTMFVLQVADNPVYYCVLRPSNGYFFKQTQTGTQRERISSGGRFVVSVNKAEKTFSLEIRDVRVEDTATYYCKAQYKYKTHSDGAVSLWWYTDYADGSGTVVTVTADSSSMISQTPPVQTFPAGDTVTLRCEYSGFCQYTVHWYRQSPGQAPEYLLQRHTSGEENKENAAGGRISASINPAEKISRLNISKLQLSDSAVYYCALSQRTAQ
ncbi:uncharacterized protein LOC144675302 [Cetorhinus maximus]